MNPGIQNKIGSKWGFVWVRKPENALIRHAIAWWIETHGTAASIVRMPKELWRFPATVDMLVVLWVRAFPL